MIFATTTLKPAGRLDACQPCEVLEAIKLRPIADNASHALKAARAQRLDEERVVVALPFPVHPKAARALESEAWVVLRVTEHDAERIVAGPQPFKTLYDKGRSDALTLEGRKHSHRREPRADIDTITGGYRHRGKRDVTDDLRVDFCDEREGQCPCGAERVDESCLSIGPERGNVDGVDRIAIVCALVADSDVHCPRDLFGKTPLTA